MAELAFVTLGPIGPVVVDVALSVTLLGAAALYQVSLSTLLADMWPQLSQQVYVLLCALALLPFVCVRDLARLGGVSAVGVLAYVMSLVLIFAAGWLQNSFQLAQELWLPASAPASAALPPSASSSTSTAWILGGRLASGFGVVSFSLGVPILAFQLQESMVRPRKFLRTLDRTLALVCAAYIAIGVIGVAVFAEVLAQPASEDSAGATVAAVAAGVQPMLLNNLPLSSWEGLTARLLVCLVLLLTSPLTLVPALDLLEMLVCGREEDEIAATAAAAATAAGGGGGGGSRETAPLIHPPIPRVYGAERAFFATPSPPPVTAASLRGSLSTSSAVRRLLLRLLVLLLVEAVTLLLPCFTLLMSLIGCVTLNLLCFILPPIFTLRMRSITEAKLQVPVRERIEHIEAGTAVAGVYRKDSSDRWIVPGCYCMLACGMISLIVGTTALLQQGNCSKP